MERAQNEGKQVHLATLMDLYQLEYLGIEPKFQKRRCEGGCRIVRCVHRARTFSVSHDAVSAYTQVKMKDALKFTENCRNRNARLFGSVYLDPVGPKIGTKFKNLCFFLERNLYGEPLAGFRDRVGCRHSVFRQTVSTQEALPFRP